MTTWVLVRGWARESGHWGRFPARLARALPADRIVTVDLPGAGQQFEATCPTRVEALVEACRQQLADRRLAPPWRLLGLSLGGMVATAWATARPDEVAACVLVNTSMRPFSPPHRRLRPTRLPRLLRLLAASDPRRAEQVILELTSSAPLQHAPVVDDWLAIRRCRPVRTANALRQLFAAARYRHPGPRPAVPVLVVASAGDGLVDPRCSHDLARRWGVELVCHARAGHDLPLDDGPWLAATVADWSRRIDAAAAGPNCDRSHRGEGRSRPAGPAPR